MKKSITLFILLIHCFSQAQFFETTEENITTGPKMYQGKFKTLSTTAVAQKEGSAAELYQKAINWVNESYKSPEDVIKGKIENEYLKINGSVNGLMTVYLLGVPTGYDGRYTIEFRFKDGRFKTDIVNTEIYFPSSKYSADGWKNHTLTYRVANRKGKPDKGGLASYELANSYFNSIVNDIVNYAPGKSNSSANNDDW